MEGKKKYNSFSAPVLFMSAAIFMMFIALPALAQTAAPEGSLYVPDVRQMMPQANDAKGVSATIQILVIVTILAIAPAILMMLTCFTRIIVVLALLRQALATQSLPPNQVLVGLAMFMTFMIMAPTWQKVHSQALSPYLNNTISQADAFDRGLKPIREFMIRQIEATDNEQDVYMFLSHTTQKTANKWAEVPTTVLIPAFVTSELKTAFIIGFRIYLPFLIIDLVISSILISMGMFMLSPPLISLPFKILLFVLVDGWHLVTGSLINSFV
jgi:flagellar biosynthetic protein FliP